MRRSLIGPRGTVVAMVLAGCASFGAEASSKAPADTLDASSDAEVVEADGAALPEGGGSGVMPCERGIPNLYCLDFDSLAVGPAPAPFTFGPFSTSAETHDPLDRAEWEIVASDSSPNAGRLRVSSPDGAAIAVRGAMELVLPENPKQVRCNLAWRVMLRAPSTGSSYPENFPLLTLFYRDEASTAQRASLVTNTLGEAQLFRSTVAPPAQLTALRGLEGLGWRRASVVFDLPAPPGSSFIEVSRRGAELATIPFTLDGPIHDVRVLIGPDYVGSHPWDGYYDDISCRVVP